LLFGFSKFLEKFPETAWRAAHSRQAMHVISRGLGFL